VQSIELQQQQQRLECADLILSLYWALNKDCVEILEDSGLIYSYEYVILYLPPFSADLHSGAYDGLLSAIVSTHTENQ
jgi:hypothetical protein